MFLLLGSCLLVLILVGRMLQMRETLLSQNLGFVDIMRLFVYLSPFFMLMLTPIACMLSVFLTYLRMGADRELTALKASGVSLFQLLPATLAFCAMCMLFSFSISFYGQSWGLHHFKLSLIEFARTKTKLSLQAGVFNQEFPGLTIYAQQVDLDSGEIRFVFVQDKTSKNFTTTVVAPEGTVSTDPDKEQIKVVFRNGRIFRRQDENLEVLHFGSYVVRLPLGNMLRNMALENVSAKELSFERLLEYDANQSMRNSIDATLLGKMRVEVQKRLALPLACLVLGLFSVPLACVFRALKQQQGLVLAMGVFLVYYAMLSMAESMGETSIVPPIIGVWIPNLVFLAGGIAFFRQAMSERYPASLLWLVHKLQQRRRTA